MATEHKGSLPHGGTVKNTVAHNSVALNSAVPKPVFKRRKRAVPSESSIPRVNSSVFQCKWQDMLKELVAFKSRHGHCLVPNRYPDNPQLGSWVSTQRRQYKLMQELHKQHDEIMSEEKCDQQTKDVNNGIIDSSKVVDTAPPVKKLKSGYPMSQERAQLLEYIGFVWVTRDPRHVPWEQRFDELCRFKKLHGHCQVPVKYEPNIPLSNWVSTQRQEYKLLKEKHRIKPDVTEDSEREISATKKVHASNNFRADAKPIYSGEKQKRISRLNIERIRKLNGVGFVWEAQRGGGKGKQNTSIGVNSAYECNFHLTTKEHSKCRQIIFFPQYQKRNTDPTTMFSTATNNLTSESPILRLSSCTFGRSVKLNLVDSVGKDYPKCDKSFMLEKDKASSVSDPTQKALLPDACNSTECQTKKVGTVALKNSVHNNFQNPLKSKRHLSASYIWEDRLEELKQFKAKRGHCLVPAVFPSNPRLSNWVSRQRQQYKLFRDNKISCMGDGRVQRLESLGFVWDVRTEEGWMERFEELRAYAKIHGNCRVPNRYSANPQLGKWVSTQRSQHKSTGLKNSSMTKQRMDLLNSIGFVWEVRQGPTLCFASSTSHPGKPTSYALCSKDIPLLKSEDGYTPDIINGLTTLKDSQQVDIVGKMIPNSDLRIENIEENLSSKNILSCRDKSNLIDDLDAALVLSTLRRCLPTKAVPGKVLHDSIDAPNNPKQ